MDEIQRLKAESAELRARVAELEDDAEPVGWRWEPMDEARKDEIWAEIARVAAEMKVSG